MLTWIFAAASLCVIEHCIDFTGKQIAAYFETHLSGLSQVYLPGSTNYTQDVTPRWDLYRTPSYVVAVKPASVSDVRIVVSIQICLMATTADCWAHNSVERWTTHRAIAFLF